MHETRKLDEAEYFLGRMVALQSSREEFVWNLNAFVTASRAVAEYARKEAHSNTKKKAGGQAWFAKAEATHPSIEFFREERRVNFHLKPVEPQTAIGVELVESIGLGEALSIQMFNEAGELVGETRVETPAQPRAESPPPVVRLHYRFADRPGSEDVITLGRIYLDALRALVADGQAKGFLS